jgi:peptidoglycan/xylan/chitin deacetylase (PgdA/CDA1 family)
VKAILTYHSIDESGSPISVSRAAFERHVAWLASGRVRVTSIGELRALPETADAVSITFDDGFRNFGEIAAPLLQSRGLSATVFVVSGAVGGTNAWNGRPDAGVPTLPLLDWSEIEQLLSGGVEFGAHTRSHPRLDALADHDLVEEIDGSAHDIERRIGRRPDGFAYPYGAMTDTAVSIVRDRFSWACTTELALLGDNDAALLPRLDMYYFRDPGRLESWGSTRFRIYLNIRSHARRIRERWNAALTAP